MTPVGPVLSGPSIMTLRSPASRTKPGSSASPPLTGAWSAPEGGGLPHGQTTATPRDGARIAIALTVLLGLILALLNVGLYQSARRRLADQKWQQLVAQTDDRRDAVRDALHRAARVTRFVAGDAAIRAWAEQAAAGPLKPEEQARFTDQLGRAAHLFDLSSVEVFDAGGHSLGSTRGERHQDTEALRNLLGRARRSAEAEITQLRHDGQAAPVLAVAVRVEPRSARNAAAILVTDTRLEDAIEPALHDGFEGGPDAGNYLVRLDGDRLVMVSSPPKGLAASVGDLLPAHDPRLRAGYLAASGTETNIEVNVAGRQVHWAVTRYLPEMGWGLVGEADRRTLLEGLRSTLTGLLVFDLAVLLIAAAAIWFWRRQYLGGLARREMEMTRKHAGRLAAVFDNAFDAIVTLDRDGNLGSVNTAAVALFGRPAAELQQQRLELLLSPVPPLCGEDRIHTVAQVEAVRPDGSRVPVEVSIGVSGEGEELRYSAIIRDLSQRLESERRIRAFADGLEISNRRLEEANAQLEEASRLKSEFLANTSHELRTPLNGMIGFLQLVLDGLCDSPEEEREFLKQALQCSRHLLGLINDVLDIAKIEAGRLTLEIERIDIAALLDEVYTLAHVQAAQKGLRLEFVPPEDPLIGVRGDFGKVKQILINLVGNSLKFTHSGSITVRALPHADLGYVMFEVVDTGVGIPAERQRLIFEKFTQGDGSTTRKYGGTGLGLAISRSLVELMGGIIGVHSHGPGTGTRMYFSLPVWRNEADESNPTVENAPHHVHGPAGGALVLVVEDDPTFRLYLGSLLHQHGYRTVDARNAEIGWLLVRRLRPSVVVLDYALTSVEGALMRTGWDLAERMTADPKTRHIPIVFVTGFDTELKQKLQANSFARKPHHLQKPIEGSVLLAKLHEVTQVSDGRTVRILMADDDPAVAAYVRKVLPSERFEVELAADGAECLHLLRTRAHDFDLLLLDLMMPEVSGYDVLREMTLADLAPDLPVMVLTNFPESRSEEERRLLQDGLVVDVVPKIAVHDNPQLLTQIIDWHVQLAREQSEQDEAGPGDQIDGKAA